MSKRRPAPGCKAAPSGQCGPAASTRLYPGATQPQAPSLDVLSQAAVILPPAAQQLQSNYSSLGRWNSAARRSHRGAACAFVTGSAAPSPRGETPPATRQPRPKRAGRRPPAAPPPKRSGAAAEGWPPPRHMAREEPPGRPAAGAGAAAFGRAMARGRTALGAIAWLCLLAAAAEGLRRRGPSVTAKVTPGRAGSGRSVCAGAAREPRPSLASPLRRPAELQRDGGRRHRFHRRIARCNRSGRPPGLCCRARSHPGVAGPGGRPHRRGRPSRCPLRLAGRVAPFCGGCVRRLPRYGDFSRRLRSAEVRGCRV